MVAAMRRSVIALLAMAACSKSEGDQGAGKANTSEEPAAGGGKTVLGVWPERWTCSEVAPLDQVSSVLGGEAQLLDSPFQPPRGVPKPCSYSVTRAAPTDAGAAIVDAWTFDVDCREDYEKRAELLFAQYARTSAELVEGYQAQVGSGKPPTDDAGVPIKAPMASHEAMVGRKALDHHGQGLLFLDDDAPCYVRVVGPDAERRLALAKLVGANLKEANAPMKPHGDPVMK
jgi:hypothetical protein